MLAANAAQRPKAFLPISTLDRRKSVICRSAWKTGNPVTSDEMQAFGQRKDEIVADTQKQLQEAANKVVTPDMPQVENARVAVTAVVVAQL